MIKIANFSISQNGEQAEPIVIKKDEPLTYHFLKVTTNHIPATLSVSQFAEAAEITPQAVRKMIAEDRVQAVKLGNQYVIAEEALARYLKTE